MTTSPITPTYPSAAHSATPTAKSLSAADSGQFMQLLLAQLRNQNPLDPVQDKDFMSQLTQLNSFQELQKMTGLLQTLAKNNHLSDAAALLGKTVTATDVNGQAQTGVVDSISLQNDRAVLVMGSKTVPFANVISVSEKAA